MTSESFRVTSAGSGPVFETSMFKDSRGLRLYYTISSSEEDEIVDKYEAVDDMLDFYSEITEKFRKSESEILAYRCRNIHKEFPVSLPLIYNYCENPSKDEAPMKLIVQIAENDFSVLRQLLENPRKVLRRSQQLVPVGRIQQIDNYCMRWLARQPGYSAEEKAGTKQKLMGVVRYETLDTLENRVLKQYMKYCQNECRRYIKKYNLPRYRTSTRYSAVKRFYALIQKGLSMLEFQDVRGLDSVPLPNYVLQNNNLYNTIWRNYLLLAKHISQLEIVWRYRHRLFYEIIQLVALAVINHELKTDGKVIHEVWMSPYPSENGNFCIITPYFDFSSRMGCSFRIVDSSRGIEFRCANYDSALQRKAGFRNTISCYFIPDTESLGDLEFGGGLSIVYAEREFNSNQHSVCVVGNDRNSGIISDVFSAVRKWYGGLAL